MAYSCPQGSVSVCGQLQFGRPAPSGMVANREQELTLMFDLAIYTAREGRSRIID